MTVFDNSGSSFRRNYSQRPDTQIAVYVMPRKDAAEFCRRLTEIDASFRCEPAEPDVQALRRAGDAITRITILKPFDYRGKGDRITYGLYVKQFYLKEAKEKEPNDAERTGE